MTVGATATAKPGRGLPLRATGLPIRGILRARVGTWTVAADGTRSRASLSLSLKGARVKGAKAKTV